MRLAARLLGMAVLFVVLGACAAGAQTVDTDLWITSGTVRALARIGDTLYVGGNFLRVSPSNGCWVPVDSVTAAVSGTYPKVRGTVRATISDGAGGWILGGNFDRVGATAVRNLAHVRADGSVQTLPSPDSTVYALHLQGRDLFVGGEFKSVGAATRRRLAAIDIATGNLSAWNPDASRGVYAMAMQGTSTLFVSGSFDSLGGLARGHLGVIDGVSGAVGAWAPTASYTYATTFAVRTLVVKDGLVYAGGEFDAIDGTARAGVAAIDASTGALTAWAPTFGGDIANIYTMIVDTTIVYVGGRFMSVGGDYGDVVALDRTSGVSTSWEQYFDGTVWSIARAGRRLYVGGAFMNTAWGPYDGAVALDLGTGEASPWDPKVNGMVTDIDIDGANVRLSGGFLGVGALHRRLLAAFDLNTGLPTSWDPSPDLPVYSMAVTPTAKLLVGGSFNQVGGFWTQGLAMLDPVTGVAEMWSPGLGNSGTINYPVVNSIVCAGDKIYIGGNFNSAGGQSRKHLAALELATGALTAWNPNPSGPVVTIALSPAGILAGGNFGTIGGASRPYLACVDTATGLATSWAPAANNLVRAIAVQGTTVYAGGSFTTIGGQSRSRIAALDASSGTATAWNPNMSGGTSTGKGVYALLPLGSTILAGGDFDYFGATARHDLAALDVSTGLATSWDPNLTDPTRSIAPMVYSLLGYDGRILAGGNFYGVGDELQVGVASISSPPLPTVGWCDVQWPLSLTALAGVPYGMVYGQVWMSGITESNNHDTHIEAQLGYGPHGSLPTDPSWAWTPTVFNVDYNNNDEFMAPITFPAAGVYDYAYRFRYRWSDWTYGDADGSANGYSAANAAVATVNAWLTGSILQWPPTASITLGDATPTIYGRVWGAGITDAPGAAVGLTAQLGYGPDGSDPATSLAWTWVSAAYNLEVDGGGEEYMATFTPPAAGEYDYAYRFTYLTLPSLYSDTDGSANGYQIARAGALTVTAAGVDDAAPRALSFALAGGNPVRGDASFRLGLPAAGEATLDVFDAAGRAVARVAPGALSAGWHTLRWANGGAAPGVYVVRLRAAGEERVTRLVVLH